jgi:hypothetical protein
MRASRRAGSACACRVFLAGERRTSDVHKGRNVQCRMRHKLPGWYKRELQPFCCSPVRRGSSGVIDRASFTGFTVMSVMLVKSVSQAFSFFQSCTVSTVSRRSARTMRTQRTYEAPEHGFQMGQSLNCRGKNVCSVLLLLQRTATGAQTPLKCFHQFWRASCHEMSFRNHALQASQLKKMAFDGRVQRGAT